MTIDAFMLAHDNKNKQIWVLAAIDTFVITSYSIHYTKLYDSARWRNPVRS